MRDDHGPFRGFKGEDDPQITVTNAVEALPLARHGFDAGHFQRVTAHGLQLRPQLGLQLSVQAFEVTRRPTVQDDSEHQSEDRGTKALESRLARSRRVARKSALASAFKSQPKASAIC